MRTNGALPPVVRLPCLPEDGLRDGERTLGVPGRPRQPSTPGSTPRLRIEFGHSCVSASILIESPSGPADLQFGMDWPLARLAVLPGPPLSTIAGDTRHGIR